MNKMATVTGEIEAEAPAELDRKSRKRLALMLSVPLLILVAGLYFWLTSGATVSTDNAYVKQDVTAISTLPRRPNTTAYMAASASAMMVGPDKVPPGRTNLGWKGTRASAPCSSIRSIRRSMSSAIGTPWRMSASTCSAVRLTTSPSSLRRTTILYAT